MSSVDIALIKNWLEPKCRSSHSSFIFSQTMVSCISTLDEREIRNLFKQEEQGIGTELLFDCSALFCFGIACEIDVLIWNCSSRCGSVGLEPQVYCSCSSYRNVLNMLPMGYSIVGCINASMMEMDLLRTRRRDSQSDRWMLYWNILWWLQVVEKNVCKCRDCLAYSSSDQSTVILQSPSLLQEMMKEYLWFHVVYPLPIYYKDSSESIRIEIEDRIKNDPFCFLCDSGDPSFS